MTIDVDDTRCVKYLCIKKTVLHALEIQKRLCLIKETNVFHSVEFYDEEGVTLRVKSRLTDGLCLLLK